MGLESAPFISGLTSAWPVAADPKSQGDDHLRLIKGVLQATFPNASKAFYLPVAAVAAANQTLLATDQNKIVMLSTAGGELTVALPTLASGDSGWACEVVKTSVDTNGITVSPPSGTITSKAGATSTIRVGVLAEPARFFWNGSSWFCWKPGVVGQTINFDGPTTPAGFLTLDGSVFSGTTFAELAAVLGTTTLRDKRGRVEAGVDNGVTGRLATGFGASGNGAVGGLDTQTLTVTQIPFHNHGGTTGDDSPDHAHAMAGGGQFYGGSALGTLVGGTFDGTIVRGGFLIGPNTGGATARHQHAFNTSTNPSGLGGSFHPNVQPTIVTQKLIRAC